MGVQVPELKQCVAFVFSSRVLVSRRECLLLLLLLLLQSDPRSLKQRKFLRRRTTRRLLLPFERQNELTRALLSSTRKDRYMDKKLKLKLNGNRGVIGILRGFDQFLIGLRRVRERLDGRKNAARDGGRERSERVVDGSVRAHRTGTKEEHYVILLVFYVYILLSIPLSINTFFIYPFDCPAAHTFCLQRVLRPIMARVAAFQLFSYVFIFPFPEGFQVGSNLYRRLAGESKCNSTFLQR